jgi:hypothetical protein
MPRGPQFRLLPSPQTISPNQREAPRPRADSLGDRTDRRHRIRLRKYVSRCAEMYKIKVSTEASGLPVQRYCRDDLAYFSRNPNAGSGAALKIVRRQRPGSTIFLQCSLRNSFEQTITAFPPQPAGSSLRAPTQPITEEQIFQVLAGRLKSFGFVLFRQFSRKELRGVERSLLGLHGAYASIWMPEPITE